MSSENVCRMGRIFCIALCRSPTLNPWLPENYAGFNNKNCHSFEDILFKIMTVLVLFFSRIQIVISKNAFESLGHIAYDLWKIFASAP